MTTRLFRPVGLHELALIWDAEMRQFPPRLPHQPIFYPVANFEYAAQIAKDWNTVDEASGFSGFVTAIEIAPAYLSKFEPHIVGNASHAEYWIPAEALHEFNAAIQGRISIESAWFGLDFKGWIPNGFSLMGKDAVHQFVSLAATWDYSTLDFACEVSTNRKTVFLNSLFWAQFDFAPFSISREQRNVVLERLKEAWSINRIAVPLPLRQTE